MNVSEAIKRRRAFRSLEPVEITEDLIYDLTMHAQLAPSCFNNQPLRLVFIKDRKKLDAMRAALTDGNRWAWAASMIIAVFSREEDDCVIRDRIYHRFDDGVGVGFLMLRATELGLVAHPIAGFSPKKTAEILGIPSPYKVITLIIVGRKKPGISSLLNVKQIASEKKRPARKPLKEVAFIDAYSGKGTGI